MKKSRLKRVQALGILLIILGYAGAITSCTFKDQDIVPQQKALSEQVRVQVAYDASNVAFKFTWKSQKKLVPATFANVGENYPMQFHDMLKHNGTKFDRLPSGQRMEEDRISLMISKHAGGIAGFEKSSCAVSCHTGMDSHHLLTDEVLDHWHWRGARSGPMGYAEDAAVNNVERIRDFLGTLPTKFVRSGGDRLREDQAALTGTAHAVLVDGLPRFVFNKGKTMPDSYVIPSYFLTNEAGAIMTNPHTEIPQVKDVSINRSLIVPYQDRSFDPVEKVNALDMAYLVWVATDEVAHLPTHLRDITSADFNAYKTYWATETGISAAPAALAKLDNVHQEWVNSGKNAMVTRSVGYIYNSDQHDVTSVRAYDPVRNEWTVVLKRKLSTGSANDEDLSGLPSGAKYTIGFAMHDAGGGSITHDISLPLVVSTDAGSDIVAKQTGSIDNVDWNTVPVHDTHWVKQSVMPRYTYDWLKSGAHAGAGAVGTSTCVSCHTGEKSLLNSKVLE